MVGERAEAARISAGRIGLHVRQAVGAHDRRQHFLAVIFQGDQIAGAFVDPRGDDAVVEDVSRVVAADGDGHRGLSDRGRGIECEDGEAEPEEAADHGWLLCVVGW